MKTVEIYFTFYKTWPFIHILMSSGKFPFLSYRFIFYFLNKTFRNSLKISYDVFGLYSPLPHPFISHLLIYPTLYFMSSIYFLTHQIQFVLSKYSLLCGHLLEYGWSNGRVGGGGRVIPLKNKPVSQQLPLANSSSVS